MRSLIGTNFDFKRACVAFILEFSVKYWIVARKLELFRAVVMFESKAKLFTYIMFGGAALIVILSLIATIPVFILFSKSQEDYYRAI